MSTIPLRLHRHPDGTLELYLGDDGESQAEPVYFRPRAASAAAPDGPS